MELQDKSDEVDAEAEGASLDPPLTKEVPPSPLADARSAVDDDLHLLSTEEAGGNVDASNGAVATKKGTGAVE